ncbi:hypothetical protein HHI36_003017 [Cryptolaemus montrouzieri]|uniref:Dynein heavy chain tail domain-containing protein n=1 Tax=Cryptolaemus montrouzieri TaxID=559131 RepID=A0ABD2PCT8_9CUCU
MDKKKDEPVPVDPRLELMSKIMLLSYRVKPDRWAKMIVVEDNLKMINHFFDDPKEKELILTLVGGQFYVYKTYDQSIKQKYTHFFRKQNEKVTAENFRQVLNFGDMSGKPIDDLSILMNHVFIPLLNHPGNQKGWPQTVKEDVKAQLDEFKNYVEEIRGAMKGETILPMPNAVTLIYQTISMHAASYGESVDHNVKLEIETAVVKWSQICKEVLKENSKSAFVDGAHPTPMEEINFWQKRRKNLQNIYDQLSDPRVKKLAEYLEVTSSSYLTTFKTLFRNVVAALIEAKDITIYLKPLIPHIKRFEENDFLDLKNYIKPLIHVVGLIWAHSRYYSFSEKIVNLFKQIANLLIESVIRNLDPSSVFLGDPEEVCDKVTKTIDMLNLFLDSFEYVREHLHEYYAKIENATPQPWNFHRRTAFQRLIEFLNRLNLVKKILVANIDYSKLERVEIGGLKGKYLSVKCEDIFTDFGRVYSVFQNITYDVLDIEDLHIHDDYKIFENKCADIDHRLASVFQQAFDDCNNLEGLFKLLNIVGNLVERPAVRAEVAEKFPGLIVIMDEVVDNIKAMYDDGEKNGILLDKYFPPVAGRIYWYKKHLSRLDKTESSFKQINNEILRSEEAMYMLSKYSQMAKILNDRITEVLHEWIQQIRVEIEEGLAKTQLGREPGKEEIFVNLDPKLEAILKEMRYLMQLDLEGLPDEAKAVFDEVENIYKSYVRLKRIEQYYNFLKESTLVVEYSMIESEMDKIGTMLEPLMTSVTWSENEPENIDVMYEIVKYLYDRVTEAQSNMSKLISDIDLWANMPLFERKDGKKENLLNIDDRNERVQKRFDQINNCTQELKNVLYHNYHLYFDFPYTPPPTPPSEQLQKTTLEPRLEEETFTYDDSFKSSSDEDLEEIQESKTRVTTLASTSRAETSEDKFNRRREYIQASSQKLHKYKTIESSSGVTIEELTQPPEPNISQKWDAYLSYLDQLLVDKLIQAVEISQMYFLNEMGDYQPTTPFLEISLVLKEPHLTYEPSVNKKDTPNLLSQIELMLKDVYNMGLFMERISPTSTEENYFNDLANNEGCLDNHDEICSRIILAMNEAADFVNTFDEYIPLWANDRNEFLQEFLKYSRRLTYEEKQQIKDEDAPPIKENPQR